MFPSTDDLSLADTLSLRLPLIPPAGRACLAETIEQAAQASLDRPPRPLPHDARGLLAWVAHKLQPGDPAIPPELLLRARHDLAVYAQHVWESRPWDLRADIQHTLGPMRQDALQHVYKSIIDEIDADGPSPQDDDSWGIAFNDVASQPKRVAGLLLATLPGSDADTLSSGGTAVWTNQESTEPPAMTADLDGCGIVRSPQSTAGHEWTAITSTTPAGRYIVDAWFDRYYPMSDYADGELAGVSSVLDTTEDALQNLSTKFRAPEPSPRMWQDLRTELIYLAAVLGLGMVTMIVSLVYSMFEVTRIVELSAPLSAYFDNTMYGLGHMFSHFSVLLVATACLGRLFPGRKIKRSNASQIRRFVLAAPLACIVAIWWFKTPLYLLFSVEQFLGFGGAAWSSSIWLNIWVLDLALLAVMEAYLIGRHPAFSFIINRIRRGQQQPSVEIRATGVLQAAHALAHLSDEQTPWEQRATLHGRTIRLCRPLYADIGEATTDRCLIE